jgi:hypothetical protein
MMHRHDAAIGSVRRSTDMIPESARLMDWGVGHASGADFGARLLEEVTAHAAVGTDFVETLSSPFTAVVGLCMQVSSMMP